jgi:hypothetical protein
VRRGLAPQQPERPAQLGGESQRGRLPRPVGLVHQHGVGHLEQTAFEALNLVARARQRQHDQRVADVTHRLLGLADADSFDQHQLEARRFTQQYGFTRAGRGTAQRTGVRRGAQENALGSRQALHAHGVAQKAAVADRARRIDGQHRHALPCQQGLSAERVHQRALAGTRRSRYRDPMRAATERQQLVQQRFGLLPMVAARALDEADGLREHASIACAQSGRQLSRRHPWLHPPSAPAATAARLPCRAARCPDRTRP